MGGMPLRVFLRKGMGHTYMLCLVTFQQENKPMTQHDIYYYDGKISPRVGKFIEAIAAARHHLSRAYDTRSALECIVLSASIIDAQLRIGIIMKQQLDNKTDSFDESLIHQKGGDKKRQERDILKMALDHGVINDIVYHMLNELYNKRNKCIHRYIISDINYQYATRLVFEYDEAITLVITQTDRFRMNRW